MKHNYERKKGKKLKKAGEATVAVNEESGTWEGSIITTETGAKTKTDACVVFVLADRPIKISVKHNHTCYTTANVKWQERPNKKKNMKQLKHLSEYLFLKATFITTVLPVMMNKMGV